jgi:hypothetical protein
MENVMSKSNDTSDFGPATRVEIYATTSYKK